MSVAKTVRQERRGKRTFRLVEKDGIFFGMADGKRCTEGGDPEQVWRALQNQPDRSDPNFFGYAGARARFLKFFANGFETDGYEHDEKRNKLKAKAILDSAAPLEAALAGSGFGEVVLSAYNASNLVSPFEKLIVQRILRGPESDRVVQAAAAFAQDGDRASLKRYEAILRPLDAAKWTIVTYLPFLWRPEHHMFLKPTATKDYASRVGHSFASVYEARLDFDVYTSLLDLAEQTRHELSDWQPQNLIDIQSFIWVVGNYPDDSGKAQ